MFPNLPLYIFIKYTYIKYICKKKDYIFVFVIERYIFMK